MEKMFLVPSDQYEVMASGQKKMNTDGKTEAADVQMARLQSDQIQSEERNKLREQKSQEDFVKKSMQKIPIFMVFEPLYFGSEGLSRGYIKKIV